MSIPLNFGAGGSSISRFMTLSKPSPFTFSLSSRPYFSCSCFTRASNSLFFFRHSIQAPDSSTQRTTATLCVFKSFEGNAVVCRNKWKSLCIGKGSS